MVNAQVLESWPCPSLVLDMDSWRPLGFNRQSAMLMGYSPEQFAGLTITDFELVPNLRETREHVEMIRRTRSDTFAALHRTKDGSPLRVQVQIKVINWAGRDAMLTVWSPLAAPPAVDGLGVPVGSSEAGTIITRSPLMHAMLQRADRVARTGLTVLIQGETGTGKDLLARRLHAQSPRAAGVFMPVNCAALPPELVDAELFGVERGAFTGADRRRAGRFEVASGGTIFLDEVGELSLSNQAKLLRVLQDGEVHRLGAAVPSRVDVRVIAATNRDLGAMVEAKAFRLDLFHRLAGLTLSIPPLRDRPEDIDAIVMHTIERLGVKAWCAPSAADRARLRAWSWPGNVRELIHVIETAVALSDDGGFNLEHWHVAARRVVERSGVVTLDDAIRGFLKETLDRCDWVVEGSSGAAARLKMRPSTLRSKLAKFGLSRPG